MPEEGRRRRISRVLLPGDEAAESGLETRRSRAHALRGGSFRQQRMRHCGDLTEATMPVAAALVLAGSGKANRDSDARLPGHRMLRAGVTKAVAGALAGAQVSTLRYDKRGIGASSGDYLRAGMTQRLADARAGLGWLAARAAGLPLLVVGHSEGAWYAAELAADEDVAGVVLLSVAARPGEQVLAWQTEMLLPRLPLAARTVLRITRSDPIRTQRKRLARIRAAPGRCHAHPGSAGQCPLDP